jgi:hypothetical protein
VEGLMRAADRAMYADKRAGGPARARRRSA